MPSSNKPATKTTTQTKSPWAPAQPHLQSVLSRSGELAGDMSNWTPTYSDATQQGISGMQQAGQGPTGGYDAMSQVVPGAAQGFGTGLDQLRRVAQGGNLDGNPYLDASLQAGRDSVANNVNGQFSAAGRYGSGAHTASLTKGLGELETQARFQNYNNERAAQDRAAMALQSGGFQGANMAGQYDQAAIRPAQYNLAAGELQDTQARAIQQAPMNALNWQAGMVNPIAGQGGTSVGTEQTVQPSNKFGQILGGIQMGAGLLSGNPFAALGGLSSMFGPAAGPEGSTGYTAPSSYRGSWGNLVGGV